MRSDVIVIASVGSQDVPADLNGETKTATTKHSSAIIVR
jgi:hypothetical protein